MGTMFIYRTEVGCFFFNPAERAHIKFGAKLIKCFLKLFLGDLFYHLLSNLMSRVTAWSHELAQRCTKIP